ncbi:uncharacterized protein BDZ99DRAFT_521496 [Mytilinidion resinicola]|uniref:Zn(2)-C6 fungal-type domain-containing protein n=1 Tax=Mytilinidion resinicola TaxID=574789 RepID=A0A6A6YKF6_9PEZI|nr:uncharacterized protein BDZ99DRAFT_521496 [Mytilinidion resinicola]KAF2809028.1 hypothetical protein BDZ99DRAFT_521496 [Mytilinidion resinicola]
MSYRGLTDSPILPAPPSHTRGTRADQWKQGEARAASKQKPQKRKQITAVACQPCKQRKSKCDGLRPACSACQQKNTSDCLYDMSADQRRTAALKEKIMQFQDHGEELKEIIQIVCETSDREEAITIVKQLQQGNYHNSTEILTLLKTKVSGFTLSASYRRDQTIDIEYKDKGSLSSPDSVLWALSPQSPVFQTADASWILETVEQKRNPFSPNIPSPSEASIPTYATSSQLSQAPSTLLSGQQASSEQTQSHPYPERKLKRARNFGKPLRETICNQATRIRTSDSRSTPVTPPGTLSTDSTLVPICLVRPASGEYNDLLSECLQSFIMQKRQMIQEGCSAGQVLGPLKLYPTVNNYNTMMYSQSSAPNVCEWVVSMMSWMNIDRHPEKMAMTLLGVLFLTWAIVPSEENYQAMPIWMRPTPTQIIMPHLAWIDMIPWPEIRDSFIRYADQLHGMEGLQTFVSNLSVNWTMQGLDVMVAIPNTNVLALSQVFEAYIRNLDNWSLDPAVLLVYPDLAGMAWFTPTVNNSLGLNKMDGQYMFP